MIAGQSRPSAPSLALQHLTDLLALLYRAVSGGSGGGASDGGASSLLRVGEGLVDLIGNTPLIRIRSLSEETGCEVGATGAAARVVCAFEGALRLWCCRLSLCVCPLPGCSLAATLPPTSLWPLLQILAKAEFLNPGGSVKDRVALQVIQEAVAEGRLRPGGLVTEVRSTLGCCPRHSRSLLPFLPATPQPVTAALLH